MYNIQTIEFSLVRTYIRITSYIITFGFQPKNAFIIVNLIL